MSATPKKYALLGLVALCVCVLALYIHRHRHGQTGRIDSLLISASGFLQKRVFYFSKGTRSLWDRYIFLVGVEEENDGLKRELAYLRTKLAALQGVELENIRLRKKLDFREEIPQQLIVANVVAHDVANDYRGIRIDKGREHGVRVGYGIISPDGLVGRVHRVARSYSDVVTMLDPTSNVDVVIQRSRARGILSGHAEHLTCKLKYVDRLDDVAVNDTVVASGFGEIFPKGLLVGYVTSVVPNPNGILQTVTVKSAVDIYRLEEVFIVVSPNEPKEAT